MSSKYRRAKDQPGEQAHPTAHPEGDAGFYQTPQALSIDRKDHIWVKVKRTEGGSQEDERLVDLYKCLTCGALCRTPPHYPTEPNWMPLRYERLTEADRAMAPARL